MVDPVEGLFYGLFEHSFIQINVFNLFAPGTWISNDKIFYLDAEIDVRFQFVRKIHSISSHTWKQKTVFAIKLTNFWHNPFQHGHLMDANFRFLLKFGGVIMLVE
jgi:hypothetical protein